MSRRKSCQDPQKKYNKVHIAYVLAITILKEVLTISEIRDGIEIQSERSGLKGAYHIFCDELELATSTVAKALKSGTLPFEELVIASDKMAMKLCIVFAHQQADHTQDGGKEHAVEATWRAGMC